MLGWFKKKFKKQESSVPQETVEQPVAEEISEETVVAHIEDDTAVSEPIVPQDKEEQFPETPEQEEAQDNSVQQEASIAAIADEQSAQEPEPEEPVPDAEESSAVPIAADTEETTEIIPPVPDDSDQSVISEAEVEEATFTQPAYQQPAYKPSPGKQGFQTTAKPKSSEKSGLLSKLSQKLSKTRESFTYQMDALFLGKKEIDSSMLDDLEEILILADLGVGTTQELLEHARRRVKRKELKDPSALRALLKEKISEFIVDNEQDATLVMPEQGPFVIMVIGVNGVGKTTTIGKIANKFIKSGSSVMLIAADTFRAAATAQLQIWGERNNVPVIAHKEGSDPSSVVFDGLGIALEQKTDVVLVDTAGRLHTKANLMEELKKIKRVMEKKLPGAPHETLLVIDATTGQNGVSQARLFNEAVTVTGLALTKLDGTSKGGIVANICRELKIPIRFIGIGEQMDDLRDFDANEFLNALFLSRSNKE